MKTALLNIIPAEFLTFANPKILRVGSSPREKISLRIVEPTKVLIPDGRGKVTMMQNDTIMASQTSTDKRESRSETEDTKSLKVNLE